MTAKERRQMQRRDDAGKSGNDRNNNGIPDNQDGNGGDRHRGGHHRTRLERRRREWRRSRARELSRRRKHPQVEATPGKAGKKAPFVKPFMNADDLMQYAQAHGTFADTLTGLDSALENQRIDSEYQKQQLGKEQISNSANANDDAASRGLFHSSIRDAELYDINATTALRQNYLDRQLDAAVISTQTQKTNAQSAWDSFQRGMNQKQVENAQEVMTNTGKWLVKPTAAKPASGYKPKPIGPRPKHHRVGTGAVGPGGPGSQGGSGGGGGNHPNGPGHGSGGNNNGTGGTPAPGHH